MSGRSLYLSLEEEAAAGAEAVAAADEEGADVPAATKGSKVTVITSLSMDLKGERKGRAENSW
jgi:hypothetical protein